MTLGERLRARFASPRPPLPVAAAAAPLLAAETLIEGLADPALLLTDTRVVAANAAARAQLGDHIVGDDARLALRHPDALALIADGGDGVAEFAGTGGPDIRVEMRVARVAPDRRLVQLVDRSARHLADRTRSEFVANASHELRTPLAAIRGFVETLQDEEAGADPAVRARFLEVIRAEARRMERLIEDLLSLSRIEAEKFVPPETAVDLAALIEEVAAETPGRDGEPLETLTLALAGPTIVAGDRAQLSQLLHNLVDNARRYGGDAPIAVRLATSGALAEIVVADRGPGIAAEHLPRLTERFYRVDPARSRASGGTGLGLAIVKHIVERHRGRMSIASAPGEGTEVTVTIPVLNTVTQPSST